MILVAVDDLLFRSKIRASGKQAGIELTFARTRAEVVARIRESRPELIVFDLNDPKIDAVGIVQELKTDAGLRTIRTLGYVSHVDTGTIEAARNAGMDEVMPRSAFATRLADILLSARPSAS